MPNIEQKVVPNNSQSHSLPKNVHIWSKLTAPTARGLPPPVLALGNQAFRRFLKIWNSYC
jgi:hypothetical protein